MQDHTKLNLMWIDEEKLPDLCKMFRSQSIPIINLTPDTPDDTFMDDVKSSVGKPMVVVIYHGSVINSLSDRYTNIRNALKAFNIDSHEVAGLVSQVNPSVIRPHFTAE